MNNWLILEQSHVMSQNQIQSLELLTMDSVTLNEFMYNEHLENPVLERKVSSESSFESFSEKMQMYKSIADTTMVYNGNSSPEEDYAYEIPGRKANAVRELILGQLTEDDFASKEHSLTEYMIELLDENGFFPVPVSEVAKRCGKTEETVQKCLDNLRELEPCGVFSENLKECLLYQLIQRGELDENLERMIGEHLDDIASGKIRNITKQLKLSTLQVRDYIALIRQLNPRPLAGYTAGETMYLVPDIILEKENGEWTVCLNDKWVEDYHISDFYLKMMESTDDEELKQYFRVKIERARTLLRNVRQRRATMIAIAEAVLQRQQDYFDGKGVLKPMTMQEIADQLGVHISTVSRGIRDKYLQYPKETVLFKDLFSQSASRPALNQEDGLTARQIQRRIKEIVDGEDKKAPFSDLKISELLAEQKIHISRRTVAKYRDALQIPGIFQRKE